MRASAWFVGVLLVGSAILGCIAYPLYLAVSTVHVWPFHRVYSRLAMLIVAILLVWLFRHLNVRTKRDFGYGLPWRQFMRENLVWAGIGILTASLGVAFICAMKLRGLDPQFLPTAANLAHILVVANPAPGRLRSSPHCCLRFCTFLPRRASRPTKSRGAADLICSRARSRRFSIRRWWRILFWPIWR